MFFKKKGARLQGGWVVLACAVGLTACGGGGDSGSSSATTAGTTSTRDINNNPGNNPAPVAAGPGGNPYFPPGTFYVNGDRTPDLPSAYNVPAQCQPTATTTSAAAHTSGN